MQEQPYFSDELLNAYIDEQLPPTLAVTLLEAMETDAILRARVQELRQVRGWVRHALQAETTQPHTAAHSKAPTLRYAFVAGLALACGTLIGWLAHTVVPGNNAWHSEVSLAAQRTEVANTRLLLHIDNLERKAIERVLDQTEGQLRQAKANGKPLQVEILVNAAGLGLVRQDSSPLARRIAQLQQRYHTVRFLACKKSMERLWLEHGIKADLLPGVDTVPSALDQILLRLHEGWRYVRI